jgi:hypothetical protein
MPEPDDDIYYTGTEPHPTYQHPTTYKLTFTADGVVGNITDTPEAQQPATSDTTSKE